jgi:hypothetical protein
MQYDNIAWYNEYDELDLGMAQGHMTVQTIGAASVYSREFELGWVLVNPSDNNHEAETTAVVKLAAPGRVRTHSNLHSAESELPVVESVTLPAHRGTFVLRAETGPAVRVLDHTDV